MAEQKEVKEYEVLIDDLLINGRRRKGDIVKLSPSTAVAINKGSICVVLVEKSNAVAISTSTKVLPSKETIKESK